MRDREVEQDTGNLSVPLGLRLSSPLKGIVKSHTFPLTTPLWVPGTVSDGMGE